MTFKKNAFVAKICLVGMLYIFAGMLFVLCTVLSVKDVSLDVYIVLSVFVGLGIVEIVGLTILMIEHNSKLTVTKDGIELKSKISGTKYIDWKTCNFIGVYGYYFGLRGNLVFSEENFICYSQRECSKYATQNHKKIILAGYTPELFAAVEKNAPAHLVSGCKALFSRQ